MSLPRRLAWAVLLLPAAAAAQSAPESFERGLQSHRMGDLAGAERGYRQAVTADPNFYEAHDSLGAVLAAQYRWNEAEAEYRRALNLRPGETAPRANLTRILLETGRSKEAITEATELVADADNLQHRLLLGRGYVSAGRIAEGCREIQRAFSFEPLNSRVQLELAACWRQNEDFEAALMHATAVTKREPANRVALMAVAEIRGEQRARRWTWVALIFAVGAACAALGARRPEQWAHRRFALGMLAMAVSWAIWLIGAAQLAMAGVGWGGYQFYAAFAHRRMRGANAGARGTVLASAARVLGCVSLADGEISDAEWRAVRTVYERHSYDDADLALIGRELRQCTEVFRTKLFEHETLYATLHAACGEFNGVSNEAMRLDLFRTAVTVALCEGPATPGKLRIVQACGTWLNVPDAAQHEIWNQGVTQSPSVSYSTNRRS